MNKEMCPVFQTPLWWMSMHRSWCTNPLFHRFNFFKNIRNFKSCFLKIIMRLQVDPGLRVRSKETGQAQRSICRDAAFASGNRVRSCNTRFSVSFIKDKPRSWYRKTLIDDLCVHIMMHMETGDIYYFLAVFESGLSKYPDHKPDTCFSPVFLLLNCSIDCQCIGHAAQTCCSIGSIFFRTSATLEAVFSRS